MLIMDYRERWIAAYDNMDQRRKAHCLAIAESQAKKYPLRPMRQLRLVSAKPSK